MKKKYVFIEGNRNGYNPEQCGSTMTVGELIDYLRYNFSEDTPILLRNDNGYTYGSIESYDINEKYVTVDDDDEE